MRNFIYVALTAFMLAGCAHSKDRATKTAYSVAAITKSVVSEAHAVYDMEARQRFDECAPEKNASITTRGEYDTCMGPYRLEVQDAVVKGLGVYRAVATAYSAVLQGCAPDPDGNQVTPKTCVKRVYSSAELREWRGRIVVAATDALRQFPRADAHVQHLLEMLN